MIKFIFLLSLLFASCDTNNTVLEMRISDLENEVRALKYDNKTLYQLTEIYERQIEKLKQPKCTESYKVGDIVIGEFGAKRRILKIGNLYTLVSLDDGDSGEDIDIKNGVKSLEAVIEYMNKNNYRPRSCN